MIDLGLLVPIAAVVALFGVIALGFRSLTVGRALRRLEEQLQQGGGSAADASLERVRQLQARAAVSTGTRPTARGLTLGLLAIVALAVIAGGGWLLFGRGGDSPAASSPAAEANQNGGDGQGGGDESAPAEDDGEGGGQDTTESDGSDGEPTLPDAENGDGSGDGAQPATPGGSDIENPPPLTDKGQYTVAIYNATNVDGAAGTITAPRVDFFGYTVGSIGDSPDGKKDLDRSVVMWPEGKEDIALNVASDLGIGLASPLDGAFTQDQVGSADAIVFVGFDLTG